MGGDVEPTLTRTASHTAVDAEKLGKHHDVGLEIFEEALGMDPDVRQRLVRRIRMKLDFGLLPVVSCQPHAQRIPKVLTYQMCFIYLMSFLDKQTLNYGNAYDLQDDLHFAGDSYSWVASIINFGILVSSYPSTLALQRFHIGKIVGIALMCWGILNMASAAARSFPHLMAIRFLLGLFESCVGPAWMLMTSVFWTRREQPLRMCFWLGSNGIALLIGAGVSWGLGHHTGTSLAPWQLIFLVGHGYP